MRSMMILSARATTIAIKSGRKKIPWMRWWTGCIATCQAIRHCMMR